MNVSLDDVSITTLSVLSEEEKYEKFEQESNNAIIRASRSERPAVYDIGARPEFAETISESKDFQMVNIIHLVLGYHFSLIWSMFL
jgi:hypothetical protein